MGRVPVRIPMNSSNPEFRGADGPPAVQSHAVAVQCRPATSASLALNGVPTLDALSVTSREPLSGATVEVRVDGLDVPPWRVAVEPVPGGGTVELDASGFLLPLKLLRRSTEREAADVEAMLLDRAGAVLARDRARLLVLPSSHWVGRNVHAPSLAAFVTPNSPVAHDLARVAAGIVGERTGSHALDGYQSGSADRVQRVAEACYEALAARGVAYQVMKSSFEDEGQKVRTLAEVVSDGLGNCLDLSVALAALLEAAGLSVVVIAADGHATVGFSTVGEPFPEPVHEGLSGVLNRMELGELRVIESTLACAGGGRFGEALARGEQWLRDVRGTVHVIDVTASRRAGFHPLPEVLGLAEARAGGHGVGAAPSGTPAAPAPWVVRLPSGVAPAPARVRSTEEARLDAWKRRLLDLTLRNKLLNDRPEAGLPLLVSGEREVSLLASRLLGDAAFRLLPSGGMRTVAGDVADDELVRGWLRTGLEEGELVRRATKAWRESVSSVEETGARSLFMAIGMLQFRAEGRHAPVHAPLLLLPVEMTRAARGEGFRVRAVAEEVVANAALVEHLRVTHGLDLGVLEALAEDGSSLDMGALMTHVRQRVRDLPGAVVHATAKLGNYSFKKLPLFHELRARADAVMTHPVVRSLLGRHVTSEVAARGLATPESTESDARFESMRLPLPADSSQVAAVASAAAGATFVLQGPPGTGKSQTITNLLAECLARGRRVLFIAEKAAALEVVSRRLREAGLGSFALDLHADHASKPAFVAQVRAALDELEGRADPAARRLAGVAADLDRARGRLRAACEALHGPADARPEALTAFRAAERCFALSDAMARAAASGLDGKLDDSLPANPRESDLHERRDAVAALAQVVRALPPGTSAALAGFGPPAWLDPEEARRIGADASRAVPCARRLVQAVRALASAMGTTRSDTHGDARRLVALAGAFATAHPASGELAEMAFAEDATPRIERHERAVAAMRKARAARDALEADFDASVLGLDHSVLAGDLRAARGRFVLFRWLATRRVRGMLSRHARRPMAGDLEGLLAALEAARGTATALATADSFTGERALMGDRPGAPADLDAASHALACTRAAAGLLRAEHGPAMAGMRGVLPASVRSGKLASALGEAREAMAGLERAVEPFVAEVGPEPGLLDDGASLEGLEERLGRLARHADALPGWSAVTVARGIAESHGMGPAAEAIVSGALEASEAADVAEAAVLAGWVRARLRESPALADCAGDRMGPLREALAKLVSEYRRGVPAALPATVRERIRAAFDPGKDDPRMRHAIRLLDEMRVLSTIRRPIRRVMRDCAAAITELMPMVLASPLTAATLLPPEFPEFDLVVFDEASQVPVWDAACALSRGRAAVIVGDSRQLPPTNFFERRDPGAGGGEAGGRVRVRDAGAVGEDEAWDASVEAFETLDSLLDEAVASGLPQSRLLWHYRSRDERLIEFSNRKSYEGRLQTFPAAVRRHPHLGVEFRWVGGVYDRGGTATNRAEAEAVVAEVRRRLLDRDARAANRSLGVVTFSEAQQSLVQDLLDEAAGGDPVLNDALAAAHETGEGVFVKNLENVQGDERATMVFSVCYGRDAAGKLHHHFGPLSLSGGERRLNVAVTRAREKVVVVSSIRCSDIDLARCTAQGARDLRDYLAYAEHGTLPALRAAGRPSASPEPLMLERRLAAALSARGWLVTLHVGTSRDYRVGLAIARPGSPDAWRLGVELDGPFHRAAAAVLDRDVVRGDVLAALGWDMMRVSCLDLLRDMDAVVKRVEARLAKR